MNIDQLYYITKLFNADYNYFYTIPIEDNSYRRKKLICGRAIYPADYHINIDLTKDFFEVPSFLLSSALSAKLLGYTNLIGYIAVKDSELRHCYPGMGKKFYNGLKRSRGDFEFIEVQSKNGIEKYYCNINMLLSTHFDVLYYTGYEVSNAKIITTDEGMQISEELRLTPFYKVTPRIYDTLYDTCLSKHVRTKIIPYLTSTHIGTTYLGGSKMNKGLLFTYNNGSKINYTLNTIVQNPVKIIIDGSINNVLSKAVMPQETWDNNALNELAEKYVDIENLKTISGLIPDNIYAD